jgi:hypothetical protein
VKNPISMRCKMNSAMDFDHGRDYPG